MTLTPDGSRPAEVAIRIPNQADRASIEAMWTRCSLETRLARFHAPVRHVPDVYLHAVFDDPNGTLVAADGTGAVIAVASLIIRRDPRTAELGVIVEDGWQHQGIGRRLVTRLITDASRRGITDVTATVLSERVSVGAKLGQIPGQYSLALHGSTCEVRVRLALGDERHVTSPPLLAGARHRNYPRPGQSASVSERRERQHAPATAERQ
jgi:GNAT superfamily N-acetyltransferase